jgi:hypothetical protein
LQSDLLDVALGMAIVPEPSSGLLAILAASAVTLSATRRRWTPRGAARER